MRRIVLLIALIAVFATSAALITGFAGAQSDENSSTAAPYRPEDADKATDLAEAVTGSEEIQKAHSKYAVDLSSPGAVVGASSHCLFVSVYGSGSGIDIKDDNENVLLPQTQFTVRVNGWVKNTTPRLKGGQLIVVNQVGGLYDGKLVENDEDKLLKPGKRYFQCLKYDEDANWYEPVGPSANIQITGGEKQVSKIYSQFSYGYNNEIPYDDDDPSAARVADSTEVVSPRTPQAPESDGPGGDATIEE